MEAEPQPAGLYHKRKGMRIQSRHGYHNGDGLDSLDPYMTCPEAVLSLIQIERDDLPGIIWEPACGDGAIVRVLEAAGFTVLASDIRDYGCAGTVVLDYLAVPALAIMMGIVTNPPYKQAERFARKAIA